MYVTVKIMEIKILLST